MLKISGMKDALHNLPKTMTKFLNPPLIEIETLEDSSGKEISDNVLEGRGIEKIIIPYNITYIYTKLEVLFVINLSGHTNALTKASNLVDELYKTGEIQHEQQYRNALDNFLT